ncbi:galactose-1-phosphate uridylyltransferase [Candidatus Woesearchaeota archaeon ex4484_78]|nr:MAG: galactose-1-phosphate uridylyltransferase [Candidatus Woesearchaeota archaeon ex4484_78]
MGELRKDYILDRWVIIAETRKKRPKEFKEQPAKTEKKTDYFAPGNEHLTPPEKGRIEKNRKWQIRWFENKFPALTPEGNPNIQTHNKFFTFSSNYGYHEIIVETPTKKQLPELSAEEIEELLKVYANRIIELEKKPHIKYAAVFKNEGPKGGTSIIHAHSQVTALNIIPPNIKEKLIAIKKFVNCPYCEIVKEEAKGTRKCFENKEFLAFCPYASRFNFETWIMPKKHITRLEDANHKELAKILKRVLEKIKELKVSYNIIIHYSPKGEDLHLCIEILPRIATWAGFEFSSGIVINSVSPERAAAYYRGELNEH